MTASIALIPKERPILFSRPMVRAILGGHKSQTRRVVKFPEWFEEEYVRFGAWDIRKEIDCPYGRPGDRLWVRETWYCDHWESQRAGPFTEGEIAAFKPMLEYRASHNCCDWEAGCPCADDNGRSCWRSSLHMPRWASRLTLEIETVRVEQLKRISREDAMAEGIPQTAGEAHDLGLIDLEKIDGHIWDNRTSVENFRELWEQINGERAPWKSNPWVWVIEFRCVADKSIDRGSGG